MEDINVKNSLKDIVSREDAASEEVKQNEIAALRERIEQDRQKIQQLNVSNRKKKTAIIWLSIFLGLFVILSGGMLANFLLYDGDFFAKNTDTFTETLSETATQQDEILTKAENNDSEAQYLMAKRYQNGTDGYEKDIQQAIEWFNRSANNQNINAMLDLADIYEQGIGTEKNNQSAFKYYFTAARLGDKQGLYKVGKFYYYGTGVDKDNDKALVYLNQSAQKDYQPAKALIEIIKQDIQPSKPQSETPQHTETSTTQG